MMKVAENRFDASLLSDEDRTLVARLLELVSVDEHPALVGRGGVSIPLPAPVFHLLVRVLRNLRAGRALILLREDETLTTQAAANYLGMSRQFFVGLLEARQIPYHRVGTHRRVYVKDLLAYEQKRDLERSSTLSGLAEEIAKAGFYDASYKGDDVR